MFGVIALMEYDNELIAGNFLEQELPKTKDYLRHYFTEPLQERFLVYFFKFPQLSDFGSPFFHRAFCDHTGMYCTLRAVQVWLKRVRDIESMATKAHETCDLALLHQIKSGQMMLKDM